MHVLCLCARMVVPGRTVQSSLSLIPGLIRCTTHTDKYIHANVHMHCAVRVGILAHKDTLIQLLRCDYGVYFVFLKLNAIKEPDVFYPVVDWDYFLHLF